MTPYQLNKLTSAECEDHYAREGVRIAFKFQSQSAVVDVFRLSQEAYEVPVAQDVLDNRLKVYSSTDGYHWLQFWMAQEQNALKLLELPARQERTKVTQSLYYHGFSYEAEDKESCYVTSTTVSEEGGNLEKIATRLAEFLAPRFALRERFFPSD